MRYSSEIQEAVDAIETKLREGVDSYRLDLASIKDRVKTIEQHVACGFSGGGSGGISHQGGDLAAKLLGSDAIKAVIKGESRKAGISVDYSLLTKNTIMGEWPHSPQTADSTIVAPDRRGGIVPGAFRTLNILDFIPTDTTASNLV